MLRRFCSNYLQRHRNPINQIFHLVGVPLTFGVSVWLLTIEEPLWALAAFLGGYLLQFAGHAFEGNDAGEVILVKRWLGRPYVEFGPSPAASKSDD